MHIPSYPSIVHTDHVSVGTIFNSEVLIEEKVDGSQFTVYVDPETDEINFRSKGSQIYVDHPEALFDVGVQAISEIKHKLIPGLYYRGEYLQKRKHNAKVYARIPDRHFIIYDIAKSGEHYMTYNEKRSEAERIGLEVVPRYFQGITTEEEVREWAKSWLENNVSILGGSIEGIVIKNYSEIGRDGKVLMAKVVDKDFQEINKANWKTENPSSGDFTVKMIDRYRTEARWRKAVQHLRDNGQLEGVPKDIGKLLAELDRDITEECAEEIKELLYTHYAPKILRGSKGGFPEWYKKLLKEGE